MGTKYRTQPEVNAGSMADIAFLLLIFFLVTATIETDMGIDRKLPPKEKSPPITIKEKNILRVVLNQNDEIMVEDNQVRIEELKNLTVDFLDNGGYLKGEKGHCEYCLGERDQKSSDNPVKAIIALKSSRQASYALYVGIQDQLNAAYMQLRNREALRLFGISYEKMKESYYDANTSDLEKSKLKTRINIVKEMYPQKISEAEIETASTKI